MMTTPRLVSLTALAASLFIVILTITQASGLTATPNGHVANLACFDTIEQGGCQPAGSVIEASFLLP